MSAVDCSWEWKDHLLQICQSGILGQQGSNRKGRDGKAQYIASGVLGPSCPGPRCSIDSLCAFSLMGRNPSLRLFHILSEMRKVGNIRSWARQIIGFVFSFSYQGMIPRANRHFLDTHSQPAAEGVLAPLFWVLQGKVIIDSGS